MEEREAINTGVTVIGAEAPSAYHVAPRTENPPPASGGGGGSPTVAASPVSVGLPGSETTGKKKRGRPRKYGPDGSVTMALSPLPLSSSAPGAGGFSITKRGKGRLGGSEFKHHKKMGMEYIGNGQPMLFFLYIISDGILRTVEFPLIFDSLCWIFIIICSLCIKMVAGSRFGFLEMISEYHEEYYQKRFPFEFCLTKFTWGLTCWDMSSFNK